MLPCLAIASSVTAIGQQMIKTTAQVVQEVFNATVVYGDTDSGAFAFVSLSLMIELKNCTDDLHDETVMVNFHCGEGPDAVKKALDFGANARKVTNIAEFPRLPDQSETESLISQHILSQSAHS